MSEWKTVWGYKSLDFSIFPIHVISDIQVFRFLCPIDGDELKLRFSNIHSSNPLYITYAEIYNHNNECRHITVDNKESITVSAYSKMESDSIKIKAEKGKWMTIKMYFDDQNVETACTFFINPSCNVEHIAGKSNCMSLKSDFVVKEPLHKCVIGIDRIYINTDLQITTLAAFGDSITHMSRWTGPLSERLYKNNSEMVVLMNSGICGNRVLHGPSKGSGHGDWFGQAGIKRFETDMFSDGFIADNIIILEGINDILHPAIGEAPKEEEVSAKDIILGLESMAEIAQRHNAEIFACTLMPFNGCKNHWKPYLEKKRIEVNQFLRESNKFDGIFDFDEWMRSSTDHTRLALNCDTEDNLHPGVNDGIKIAEEILKSKKLGV